jgi:hypothetical protein
LLRRNMMRSIMLEAIGRDPAPESDGRQVYGWRAVAAAWMVLLLLALGLLAGVSAAACPRPELQPQRHLNGAGIPQHDPCVGPGLPSAQDVDGCKIIPLGRGPMGFAGYG